VAFYGNWMKMCADLALNWRQKNWLLHSDNAPPHTSFSTMAFLTKSNITVGPHSSYFL
jgi:hypothetical protein